jgi:hypothetical protein
MLIRKGKERTSKKEKLIQLFCIDFWTIIEGKINISSVLLDK